MKHIVFLLTILASTSISAAGLSASGKVGIISTFSKHSYENGGHVNWREYINFSLQGVTTLGNCATNTTYGGPLFVISKDDTASLSVLLASKMADKDVEIFVYDDNFKDGASSGYCVVDIVRAI